MYSKHVVSSDAYIINKVQMFKVTTPLQIITNLYVIMKVVITLQDHLGPLVSIPQSCHLLMCNR